jgi:hypothetical protein
MKEKLRFLGLDVHAETIAVAMAEPDGEVRSLGTIPNRAESIRKMIKKLGAAEKLRACYEAGPTGYVVYWQLAELGVQCEVVAPTLVPVKAGDRVKTDRRDAEKLARCYRSGDLTAVWVPDEGSEALRDLVRAREAAKQDQMRARHRLSKFLLRSGQRPPSGVRSWTRPYLIWVAQLRFPQRLPPGRKPQPEKNKSKDNNFPNKEKAKTLQSMNGATYLEHRASSRLSKHEGESSFALCDRLDLTRANSQRQLPTDHDYAVPTREYQTDQSSFTSAQAAARSVLRERQRQRQKQPHRSCGVDTVTPYQGDALIESVLDFLPASRPEPRIRTLR